MMVPMHARLIRPAFQGFIRTQPVFPLQKEQQYQRQKTNRNTLYLCDILRPAAAQIPCWQQSTLDQQKDDHLIFLLISPVQYCVTKLLMKRVRYASKWDQNGQHIEYGPFELPNLGKSVRSRPCLQFDTTRTADKAILVDKPMYVFCVCVFAKSDPK